MPDQTRPDEPADIEALADAMSRLFVKMFYAPRLPIAESPLPSQRAYGGTATMPLFLTRLSK